MTSIDKVFYKHAEEFFGKTAMERITDEQVEEARVWACRETSRMTAKYGLLPKGTTQELFNNYLFSYYL